MKDEDYTTLAKDEERELAHLVNTFKEEYGYNNSTIDFSEKDILNLIANTSYAYDLDNSSKFSDSNYQKIINPGFKYDTNVNSFAVNDIRKDFPIFNTGKQLIWLDNAATTQKPSVVIDAISNFYSTSNSNIHRGNYDLSDRATEMYEDVRTKVAEFINAGSANDIIFVRGATEGINLVANTFGTECLQRGDEIIITHLEHHSNILPWQKLCQEKGCVLKIIPISHSGDILLENYVSMLNKKTKLVAIAHVSNALGTVLPIMLMTNLAKQYGAYVLIDGAQSTPHFDIDVQKIGCDFFIFSGHKLFAPTGIGVVYAKHSIMDSLPPWQVGGGMIKNVTFTDAEYMPTPYKYEAGTGSIASVCGLGAAIDYLREIGLHKITAYEKDLLDYTISLLSKIPKLTIIGNPQHRTGVAPFIITGGVENDTVSKALNEKGIALRIGHHCAQPTMAFYGVKSMIRPSLAFYNTAEDVDILVKTIKDIVQ